MFKFSLWTTCAVAAAYVAASEAALHWLRISGATPLLWLASGLGLAALLLRGIDALPGLWIGAFACVLLAGHSLPQAVALSLITTLQIGTAWWLLRHAFGLDAALERMRDVLLLIVVGAGLIASTSAAAGLVNLWWRPALYSDERYHLVQVAALGELIGTILLVPPILAWVKHARSGAIVVGNEAWLLYAVGIAVSLIVFSAELAPAMSAASLPYALFPVTFWAALRLGIRDTATVLVLIGAIAVGYHAQGMGPFIMPNHSLDQSVAQFGSLYLFLVVLSVTSLLAAAGQHQREAAERQLRDSEQRAREHLNQLAHVARVASMGEMASAIAHEINQPLTAIANYANASLRLLKAGKLSHDDSLDTMQRLATEAERAGAVVRKMRGFVRGEEGNPVPVDVDELFADVLRLTSAEARQYEVEVVAETNSGLPRVLADTVQIQQVLLNLVRNASEAMAQVRTPERRVTLSAQLADPTSIEICVRDTGPGLSVAHVARVFEPFYTTKPEGLGIGLALCRSIVDAHGGRLWAEPGERGGVFRLTLPLARIFHQGVG